MITKKLFFIILMLIPYFSNTTSIITTDNVTPRHIISFLRAIICNRLTIGSHRALEYPDYRSDEIYVSTTETSNVILTVTEETVSQYRQCNVQFPAVNKLLENNNQILALLKFGFVNRFSETDRLELHLATLDPWKQASDVTDPHKRGTISHARTALMTALLSGNAQDIKTATENRKTTQDPLLSAANLELLMPGINKVCGS